MQYLLDSEVANNEVAQKFRGDSISSVPELLDTFLETIGYYEWQVNKGKDPMRK